MKKIREKVCCDSRDFLKNEDMENFILEGILVNQQDGTEVRGQMLNIAAHSCEKTDARCIKQIDKDGKQLAG